MLRCLHNMSRVTIALITWLTMSAALFCSTRPLSGVEVSAEYPDQITEAPQQMALDSSWPGHGGEWAALTLPPVTVRLLDIPDMRQARQSLSSPPYPGQARPRSARSDKVRPILLMRS